MVASLACEVTGILTQRSTLLCEDWSDLTSPTSNHIQDIVITISVAYDTLKNIFHACILILFNPSF